MHSIIKKINHLSNKRVTIEQLTLCFHVQTAELFGSMPLSFNLASALLQNAIGRSYQNHLLACRQTLEGLV